ncbi:DedA family protein [Patescibacteria group bacterium]|nr:DedA family protein [Patescibacteria group bacterium]
MFDSIQNWLLSFTAGPAEYIGLFLFGALATTMVPLSPEVAAIGVWKAGMPIIPTIIVLTIGNYAGNALNYWIGRVGEYWILGKYFRIKKERLDRAQRWFEKFGPPILLFSWLPIIGDPLTFVPGIVKYSFKKFSIYVIIGKLIKYIGLYYMFAWWI